MPKLNENELQSIKSLEQELIDSQQIEIRMKSTDGRNPVQAITNVYAASKSLYTDPDRLNRMIEELEFAQERYIKNAGIRGRILGKKAIQTYLAKSERADLSQRQLRLINKSTDRQAKRRLDLALTELGKEKGILKDDIALFFKRGKAGGLKDKDLLNQLVIAGRDKDGVVQGFAKRVKRVTVDAKRREQSAREIDEYLKESKFNEQFVWITVSKKPCPDCRLRAGKILPYDRWVKRGLPGTGRTICGASCLCKIVPIKIADEKFPTVREFSVNKDTLVLATASDERVFEARKNQYKFLEEDNAKRKRTTKRK